MMEAAVAAGNREILRYYVSEAHNNWDKISKTNHILHKAAQLGKLPAIQFSLDLGARIESKEPDHGYTALALAVEYGHGDAVQHLLDAGADQWSRIVRISREGQISCSLLQEAATSSETRLDGLAKDLASADAKASDFATRMRLWEYCFSDIIERSEHGKVITVLLDHGADLFIQGKDGESILHMSVTSKSRVKAVLEHVQRHPTDRLDVDTPDMHGRTPIHYAAAICNHHSMELLIDHGANVLAADKLGADSLHFSVYDVRCADIALQHGCQADKKHPELGTPLQFFRALPDADSYAIASLENSSTASIKPEDLQTQPRREDQHLPDIEAEGFIKTVQWINQKSGQRRERRKILQQLPKTNPGPPIDNDAKRLLRLGKRHYWLNCQPDRALCEKFPNLPFLGSKVDSRLDFF
ncbi:MAG: hypothetical protein LQ343_000110 [Gyalolechia ehrenbergii]|nr:MAG: hypothetical protein LQ343_000110 [Gyalolechia ehrenbergii]